MYRSMMRHFQLAWKNHGWKGFYSATPAVCIGKYKYTIMYVWLWVCKFFTGSVKEGFHFVIYEQLKQSLAPHVDEYFPSSATTLITSGTARVASTTVFYPFEVIRTRLFENGRKRYSN